MPEDKDKNYGLEEILSSGSVVRTMYPSYRVFIYGKEVTNDVTSVRVNNAGGSAERTAGSCLITLNNKNDRYVITHEDMFSIAKSMSAYNKYIDGTIKQSDYDAIDEFQHLNRDMFDALSSEVGEIDDVTSGIDGRNEILQKELMDYKEREHNRLSIAFDSETPWMEIKKEVITEKLRYTSRVEATNYDSELIKYPEGIIYDYPFQEGDCVFHQNDPVRVAFRDPFDARIWYWMFTGFVTTFTEDKDVNKNSVVTLGFTDVSKMARYSMIQFNTGFMDPNVEKSFKEQLQTVANSGVIPFQQIFEGFTIFEILETIFFGSKSTSNIIDEFITREITSMDDISKRDYLLNNIGMTPGELDEIMFTFGEDFGFVEPEIIDAKIKKHKQSGRIKRLDTLNMPAVSSPRNVEFKRKEDRIGINYYYYQYDETESNRHDKALGTGIKDLNEWNEIIHHRVRESDILDMLATDSSLPSGLNASNMKIDDVITTIGTDLERYPVGGGKVYYFVPATLNTTLGDVFDRGFGSISSMNSHFRDRLSFVYDLAETIDFRFYATPKGDLVFEMPFYDFDPSDFTGKYGISDKHDINKDYSYTYMDLFGHAYDGKYDNVEMLTNLSFEATSESSDIEIYNYENQAEFNWARAFTIEEHEQLNFSNTSTDEGVLTIYRAQPKPFENQSSMNESIKFAYQKAEAKHLIPTLGYRIKDGNSWGFISGDRAAQFYCALMLNRSNAEARNLNVPVVANFGCMVNRPIFWRTRNYYANIVSLQHSIVWNSSISTDINMNQIRGWGGKLDEYGKPIHSHFGNGNRPFNMAELLKQTKVSTNKKK